MLADRLMMDHSNLRPESNFKKDEKQTQIHTHTHTKRTGEGESCLGGGRAESCSIFATFGHVLVKNTTKWNLYIDCALVGLGCV